MSVRDAGTAINSSSDRKVFFIMGNIMEDTKQMDSSVETRHIRTGPEDKSYTVSIPRHYQAAASMYDGDCTWVVFVYVSRVPFPHSYSTFDWIRVILP